jgi:TetR/AcrR family transcriptional repressor of nem operon
MSTATTTTKERILDAAEELMLAKSFHSVGLNEILTAVNVPKGSFYHYFQSKEQFGVELIRHYVADATVYKRKMLLSAESEPNPLERLSTYLNGAIAKMLENDCKQCCLVLKLGTEVSTMSDSMRVVLADGMRDWVGVYEKLIREGQQKKVMDKALDPSTAAAVVHDYWMGAVQRMLVSRQVAPLRTAATFIREYLEA